jgi:hypothetical protein
MLGHQEWVLRLVPLISGLLLILAAIVLARRELKSTAAKATFVGLVALSPVLIYYSSEFKQYSSDALVALCILLAVSYRDTRYGIWLLVAVGFVGIIFSLSAVFVAAPVGLLIVWEATRSSRWKQAIWVGVAWSAAAALHATYFLQAGVERDFMVQWWGERKTFAPFPPRSVADLLWYPRAFSSLTYLIFRQLGHAHPVVRAGWFDPLAWSLALVLLSSLAAVIMRRRWTAIVAAGAILATLFAAMLGIYPFSSRLLIFLVPPSLFIIACGIDELHRASGLAAGAATVLLLSIVVFPAVEIAQNPKFNSDMRGAFSKVSSGYQDGDGLVLAAAGRFLIYYGKELESRGVPILKLDKADPPSSAIEFAEKNGFRRVWVVAYRRWGKQLIKETGQRASVDFDWKTHGTRVMLFDFARAKPRP